MTEQFQDQGGVASMSPSPFKRWLMSKIVTRITSLKRLDKQRNKREQRRQKEGRKHIVEYFHQVNDGYSHLAAQMLKPLLDQYDIELVCHLVSGPKGDNAPEPELLLELSRQDAFLIAPEYNLNFPNHPKPLSPDHYQLASKILANLNATDRINHIHSVSAALWNSDDDTLTTLSKELGQSTQESYQQILASGNQRRDELKHYSGGMFFYEGEWYWGVDRLHYLEKRLTALGANKANRPLLAPRPTIANGPNNDNGSLTLEIFPSLRSPYTAVIFDKAVELAKDSGVNLVVRPVLPMVMRGVPATREKGMYIFSDCVREAAEQGIPYGNVYDPIGDPVRRAYSLYPWACEQGKGTELISAFLSCAFSESINTNNDNGLRKVVEKAGLDWQQAKPLIGQSGWEELLEENRQIMYKAGLWGVPSFRLLDKDGQQQLAIWGQDRLWLVAREIQRLLSSA
jgi:2-hydroxychromene-2-carboxylate isomerase